MQHLLQVAVSVIQQLVKYIVHVICPQGDVPKIRVNCIIELTTSSFYSYPHNQDRETASCRSPRHIFRQIFMQYVCLKSQYSCRTCLNSIHSKIGRMMPYIISRNGYLLPFCIIQTPYTFPSSVKVLLKVSYFSFRYSRNLP